jgi:hypothetical protein
MVFTLCCMPGKSYKPWDKPSKDLAADADVDPRTAAKFLNGEHIRTRNVRERLESSAAKLGLVAASVPHLQPDEATP